MLVIVFWVILRLILLEVCLRFVCVVMLVRRKVRCRVVNIVWFFLYKKEGIFKCI